MKRIGVVGLADGWSSQQLVSAFQHLGADAQLIEMEHVVVDLTTGSARHGDVDLRACDAIVLRKIGSPLFGLAITTWPENRILLPSSTRTLPCIYGIRSTAISSP